MGASKNTQFIVTLGCTLSESQRRTLGALLEQHVRDWAYENDAGVRRATGNARSSLVCHVRSGHNIIGTIGET